MDMRAALMLHVFAALLWAGGVFFTSADAAGQNTYDNHDNREPLENFVLERYGGGQINLADYRGRVVLVNFWATWCPPCVAEFPSLPALKDGLKGRPFEILAINMGEPDDVIAGFIGSLGRKMNFPVLVDRPVITVAERWPVRVLPTTIIVDKAGNLALKVRGERAWNNAESRALIRPFLDE